MYLDAQTVTFPTPIQLLEDTSNVFEDMFRL